MIMTRRNEEMFSRSKSLLVIVCLALLTGLAGFALAQSSDYQTAISFVQRGEFDKAVAILEQILNRTPNDLKARNAMGIALSGAGRKEEAKEQFKKVLALDPKFVPALKNIAVNELALGEVQDARVHFEEALRLAPKDVTCHWGLAEIAFAAGEFERAAAHYEQSGDLALRDPRVTIRFANSYVETKEAAKATALVEKIPETDANINFQAGLILARLEKFDAAARRFELARDGYPDPYQARFNLALVLVKSGNYAAAIWTGEEMLAAGYRKAELYNLLAQAYEKDGKTKQAYDSLRTATQIEPEDETNYLDLIILCIQHENYELSLEVADIGIRKIPTSHRLHLQRGAILAMREQFEDAAKEFQTAGQLSPEAGLPQVALGFMLIQMSKLPEAIDLLRRQSRRNPKDPHALWLLGEALNRSGIAPGSEPEKQAVSALEKSVQLDPLHAQPRALLGKLLLRRGEVNRAIEQLEKAVEIDPRDMTATYQLALALQRKGDAERAKQLFAKVSRAGNEERGITQRSLLRIFKIGSQ